MRAGVTDKLLWGIVLEKPLVHEHLRGCVSRDSLEVKGVRQLSEPIRDYQDEAEAVLGLRKRPKDVDGNKLQWRRCWKQA